MFWPCYFFLKKMVMVRSTKIQAPIRRQTVSIEIMERILKFDDQTDIFRFFVERVSKIAFG